MADRDALEGRADNDSVGADEAVDACEELEGGSAVVAVDDQDLRAELSGRLVVWERERGGVAGEWLTSQRARLGDARGLDLPAVVEERVHRVRSADRGELLGGGIDVAGGGVELRAECVGVVHVDVGLLVMLTDGLTSDG